jgi:hypothetical protein
MIAVQDDKKVIMDAVRCKECGGVGYKPVERISAINGKNSVGCWEPCSECNHAGRKVVRVIGDDNKKVCGIGTGMETKASSKARSELNN